MKLVWDDSAWDDYEWWQAVRSAANIAIWTGHRGDVPEALRLTLELLADQIQILGPNHPATLGTRSNIAALTQRARGTTP